MAMAGAGGVPTSPKIPLGGMGKPYGTAGLRTGTTDGRVGTLVPRPGSIPVGGAGGDHPDWIIKKPSTGMPRTMDIRSETFTDPATGETFVGDPRDYALKSDMSPTTAPATSPVPNINQLAAQGIKQAGLGTMAGMGYKPLSVTGTDVTASDVATSGLSPTVTAGQLSSTSLDPYLNPYTREVIDAQQADVLRGATIGLDQLGAQANAAKAFGGSRHGIAMSEMGRGVADMMGQQSAGLRQANYSQAQQSAMQDIMNDYNAQIANQQAGQFDISQNLQAQLANQQAGLQGQLANQSTGMQAQLANQATDLAGAGHRLGAASQLGSLSNLGFGMGQTVSQNLATQGAMQQALQQAVMDAAAGKYGAYTGHPAQGLGLLTGALSPGVYSNPKSTTTSKQPGLFDYLTLGASMQAGQPLGSYS